MKINMYDNQERTKSSMKLDLGIIKKSSAYLADKFEKSSHVELNVIFTDRDKIRKLNKKYRNIDEPTDVLSFSYLPDRNTGIADVDTFTAGEIMICPQIAAENLKQTDGSWSITLEIIYLIIHGMLHIYDYHHGREQDRINMERIQNSLMNDVRNAYGI